MPSHVALLRGINVGGRNRLPMAALVAAFEAAGCANVSTYIQSGNVAFDAPGSVGVPTAGAIGDAIERQHGFRPAVMIMTSEEFGMKVAANPFPDATAQPTTLHLYFLADAPGEGRIAAAEALLGPSEAIRVIDEVLYVHAPDGIARSKLVAGVDRALATQATGRNWRTVTKLAELAGLSV